MVAKDSIFLGVEVTILAISKRYPQADTNPLVGLGVQPNSELGKEGEGAAAGKWGEVLVEEA